MIPGFRRKQDARITLAVLGLTLICLRSAFAAELDVEDLIRAMNSQIDSVAERAKKNAKFAIKDVELTISYAVEKKGEGGFTAYVITASSAISSQATQTMKITLTPTRRIMVEAPAPRQSIFGRVLAVGDQAEWLELSNVRVATTGEGTWEKYLKDASRTKLAVTPETELFGVKSVSSIKPGARVTIILDSEGKSIESILLDPRFTKAGKDAAEE